MNEIRLSIMQCAMRLYQKQGLYFTLDDIASELHIAKKTIYKYFKNKEELLISVLDYAYQDIYQEKQKILASSLPYIEKLKRVMIALPDDYVQLDLGQLNRLDEQYPNVYTKLQEYLRSQWDPIIHLLEEGIKENELRAFSIPVFQNLFIAGVESLLNQDALKENHMTYKQGLEELIEILVEGVRVNEKKN